MKVSVCRHTSIDGVVPRLAQVKPKLLEKSSVQVQNEFKSSCWLTWFISRHNPPYFFCLIILIFLNSHDIFTKRVGVVSPLSSSTFTCWLVRIRGSSTLHVLSPQTVKICYILLLPAVTWMMGHTPTCFHRSLRWLEQPVGAAWFIFINHYNLRNLHKNCLS